MRLTSVYIFEGERDDVLRFELDLLDVMEQHPAVTRRTAQSHSPDHVLNSVALHALAESEARSGR